MKTSNCVLKLRLRLLQLAREELRRRREAEVDPAVVEAAIRELAETYDQMQARIEGTSRWDAIINTT
jgi:hypothetical protein